MITHEDQLDLFNLISRNLDREMECWAFGGTAMMFSGFKDETKDIDLLFEDEEDREEFIRVIEKLGFKKTSPFNVYVKKKAEDANKPVMYELGDSRLDLFAGKVFRSQLSPQMREEKQAVHDFTEGERLRVNVMKEEHVAYLKAITERDKDLEDIITILEKTRDFDWELFTDEAVWQHEHGDDWALLDVEKTLRDLKDYVFIPEDFFEKLYEAQE